MDAYDTHGCCTAKMLYGWSMSVNGQDIMKAIKTKMTVVDQMIRMGFFLDFAVIYAFTTKTQLTSTGSFTLEMLEGIGFTRAFDGGKDNSGQRHKETGEITLWAISPADYKAGLEGMKKKYTEELDALETPEMKVKMREAFPDFTLTELIKTGLATRGSVKDSFAERIQIDRTAFENHFALKFGFNPRSALGISYWSGPVLALKEYHQEWKAGKK